VKEVKFWFSSIKHIASAFPKGPNLEDKPSNVGWNPRLRLAEDGLAGGRLREAQKPLKKKNCLSTERWSLAFWL
jgi:hypothetical protein